MTEVLTYSALDHETRVVGDRLGVCGATARLGSEVFAVRVGCAEKFCRVEPYWLTMPLGWFSQRVIEPLVSAHAEHAP